MLTMRCNCASFPALFGSGGRDEDGEEKDNDGRGGRGGWMERRWREGEEKLSQRPLCTQCNWLAGQLERKEGVSGGRKWVIGASQ